MRQDTMINDFLKREIYQFYHKSGRLKGIYELLPDGKIIKLGSTIGAYLKRRREDERR